MSVLEDKDLQPMLLLALIKTLIKQGVITYDELGEEVGKIKSDIDSI